ncbi:transposase [Streptomyces antimycoticus]|uniref:transposase n=1 Tax=Streptomyces antimycoticus TaxID=68175 RepID=UPI000A3B3138|nr:transposase [Streptomyces antimycoticus]
MTPSRCTGLTPRWNRSSPTWRTPALGHLPPGKFTANAAWLTLAATAYNLTRAAGHLASAFHAKARTGTIRRHLIAVPARIARPGRQAALHLPQRWRWADDFADLWTATGQRMQT